MGSNRGVRQARRSRPRRTHGSTRPSDPTPDRQEYSPFPLARKPRNEPANSQASFLSTSDGLLFRSAEAAIEAFAVHSHFLQKIVRPEARAVLFREAFGQPHEFVRAQPVDVAERAAGERREA